MPTLATEGKKAKAIKSSSATKVAAPVVPESPADRFRPIVLGGTPLPEEATRAQWDRGCADWPIDADPLDVQVEKSGGDLRVRVRLSLAPEPGETLDEALESVLHMLDDESIYSSWVMPGINDKPGGGDYFVTVEKMRYEYDEPTRHRIVTGDYKFKVLWFERVGVSSLLYRADTASLPACPTFKDAIVSSSHITRMIYRMMPREDLLQYLVTEILAYKQNGRVEMRLRLVARPSRIAYELLPEAMVKSQLKIRGLRIWNNFVDLRRSEFGAKAANRDLGAPSKAAAPKNSGR